MSDLTDEKMRNMVSGPPGSERTDTYDDLCSLVAECRRHRASQAASKERVVEVVTEAIGRAATRSVDAALGEIGRQVGAMGHVLAEARADGLAATLAGTTAERVADQLATPAVLSAEERASLLRLSDYIQTWALWGNFPDAKIALDRLLGVKP